MLNVFLPGSNDERSDQSLVKVGIFRTTTTLTKETSLLCVSTMQTHHNSNNLQVVTKLPLMLLISYAPQNSFMLSQVSFQTEWNLSKHLLYNKRF